MEYLQKQIFKDGVLLIKNKNKNKNKNYKILYTIGSLSHPMKNLAL